MRTLLLAIVFIFGFLNPAAAAEEKMTASAIYTALTQTPEWLNTSRALTPDDLKGRLILIDFWTYCCINCIHVIPKLQQLEHEFGDKLTVIGIHSAKFANEGETKNIREAIQKYDLQHPVVNDADFRIWNSFGARAWPTLALIGPDGLLKNVYQGEGDLPEMQADIRAQIEKAGDRLVITPLPIALEKDKLPPTILRFPTKLVPFNDTTLAITDSGHQRIILVDINTQKITKTIGSGTKGFKDGTLAEAQFNDPQGLLVDGDLIYVADTGNHRLRLIDLKSGMVTTLAGTGDRGGYALSGKQDAAKTALASPWDLAFYPDKNTIVIANAGSHQLWSYDRNDKKLQIIAGNGREFIDDGALPFNSLSQPSGLSVQGNTLYFMDSETSALRDFNGKEINTLIGTGLFDFGLKDGKQGTALMQHPIGLYADAGGIFIADTYNHAMRFYKDGTLSTLPISGLAEPNGITRMGDVFYIADTNHHRIVKMDEAGKQIGILDVMPMERPLEFQDRLPNALDLGEATITPKATLKITLPGGWHLNPDAPSYLGVFDQDKKGIIALKTGDLKALSIPLDLAQGAYHLQGILYYCENKEGSQCLIHGVNMVLHVATNGTKEVDIPLKQ